MILIKLCQARTEVKLRGAISALDGAEGLCHCSVEHPALGVCHVSICASGAPAQRHYNHQQNYPDSDAKSPPHT